MMRLVAVAGLNKGYESTASTLVMGERSTRTDLELTICYFDSVVVTQSACVCYKESLAVIICKFPLK